MFTPTMDDYVKLMFTLYEQFVQEQAENESKRVDYSNGSLIVLFSLFLQRKIMAFKAQRRWLEAHPEMQKRLNWQRIPDRTTLSRRYKQLYPVVQAFVQYIGQYADTMDSRFSNKHLVEDKSLFKACGPVWHESDRQAGRIPEKLRRLDRDATWCKSGYHGWVYGYGLHVTCNHNALPVLVQVETAALSESTVLDQKEKTILQLLKPHTLSADNSYCKATRIRHWVRHLVTLLTPAAKWRIGRFAKAYHRFLRQPLNAQRLRKRRTTIEPLFDLVAKLIGTTAKQKQLALQSLANVRTCLALATLNLQIAMLANCIWGLPLRNISIFKAAFS